MSDCDVCGSDQFIQDRGQWCSGCDCYLCPRCQLEDKKGYAICVNCQCEKKNTEPDTGGHDDYGDRE